MDDSKLRGGKILRSADPLNLEMPFERLESFITRVELFMSPDFDSRIRIPRTSKYAR